MTYQDEPTDLDVALWDRGAAIGWPYVGPLTRRQADAYAGWERYQAESEAEYEAQQRAGGRTVCPVCGRRTVVHSTVCTLGYPGHPGAEMSGYARCERCSYQDLA